MLAGTTERFTKRLSTSSVAIITIQRKTTTFKAIRLKVIKGVRRLGLMSCKGSIFHFLYWQMIWFGR
jgi:hypothetical protein